MRKSLSPYATTDDTSLASREYIAKLGTIRSQFERDRDRILHSKSFRRLSHKSHVFVYYLGDHHRYRLTHTLEVESISISIASMLGLNISLCSAISLAHDLGTTPFGKSGENSLNRIMGENSLQGFRHNHQGVRIVERLERQYPDYEGLNLTLAVKEGILKHNNVDKDSLNLHSEHLVDFIQDTNINIPATLEAQTVRVSDEIAQIYHYVEDGLRYNLITENTILGSSLWDAASKYIKEKYNVNFEEFTNEITYEQYDTDIKKLSICRFLIKFLVANVIQHSQQLIKSLQESDITPGTIKTSIIDFDTETREKVKKFFNKIVVPNMLGYNFFVITSRKCERIISDIFEAFRLSPEQLPITTFQMYKKAKKQEGNVELRVIADHISGMTDRYALKIHKDLFDVNYIPFPFSP